MNILIYESLNNNLKKKWLSIEGESPTYVFQTWEWVRNWVSTVGIPSKNIEICIVVVEDKLNKPKLILPFCKEKKFGIKVLQFIGGESADYMGPLIHESCINSPLFISKAINHSIKKIKKFSLIHFSKLPEFIPNYKNPLIDILDVKYQGNAFSKKLPNTWEEFHKNLKKKLRQDNNRQRRRLSEMGNLEFKVIDSKDPVFIKSVNTMIEQKSASYLDTGVPNLFKDQNVQKFYLLNLTNNESINSVHFSTLELNGEILAAHWGAVHQGRFYYLMPSYRNDEFSKFSPGRLLLENLIQLSIEKNLKIFDFTVGGEAYKLDWCDTEMKYFEYISSKNIFGYPYQAYIYIKKIIKQKKSIFDFIKNLNKKFNLFK